MPHGALTGLPPGRGGAKGVKVADGGDIAGGGEERLCPVF